MFDDLRYACRTLRHSPGFATIAVVSLGLGIGANSAIYSFADFMLFRTLPVPRGSEIMIVQSQFKGESLAGLTDYSPVSYPDFDDFRKRNKSFAGVTATDYFQFGFTTNQSQSPEMKFGVLVSGNFFDVMEVQPALGRSFRPDEDKVPGRDAVVVLGYDLWKTDFGSNPAAIGRVIFLNGIPFTVIGVAPESLNGPDNFMLAALYVPFAMRPALVGPGAQNALESRDWRSLRVQGRLKPGVRQSQAAAEAKLISAQLAKAYPKTNSTCTLTVSTNLQAQLQISITTLMVTFLGSLSAVVLLIACANVMNLMLSRASARSREIAVRLAIGAGRGRLIRQLLTESLVIALAGGALGLLVAQLGAALFGQIRIPIDIPMVIDIRIDPRVLLFTLLISIASAILFGLVPAIETTRTDLVSALKAGRSDPGRRRLLGRNALVVAQVAGSLLLLVLATQSYRGAAVLLNSPAGFRTDHILMASFNPTLARSSDAQTKDFYKRLVEQARTLPGAKSAALTQAIPVIPSAPDVRVIPEGVPLPAGTEAINVMQNIVTEDYFDTLGIPVIEGRAFKATDREDSPHVAIINERFLHKYYPKRDAIGKRLRMYNTDGPWVQIVGVAKQSKYLFSIEPPLEFLYLPLDQKPPTGSMALMIETRGPSAGMAAPLRDLVRRLDAHQPIFGVRTMEELYDVRANQTLGILTTAIGGMALLALVLAMVGLYGLMTYSVSLRQREMGIRMAIGGDQATVVRMVLKQAMVLAGTGVAIGLAVSLAVSKPTAAIVNADNFNWPWVGLVTIALLAMAGFGAYIPARRASRVDPNTVLREE